MAIALMVHIPVQCIAQTQPSQSVEQSAALKEAEQLNQQVEKLYQEGNYSAAIPLAERALSIYEKVLGANHPLVANILNNLALMYEREGNYQQAEPLYQRALSIFEKALGANHPLVANSLSNLSALYQAEGEISRAVNFYTRGLAVEEENLKLIFAVGSEQRKQNYARTFIGTTYGTVSLALTKSRNNREAGKLALTTVLRRKGRVLDAVADSIQILRSQVQSNPETKNLFDRWLNILQQQSALVFSDFGKQTASARKARFEQLSAENQQLEAAISAKSSEFRTQIQPTELAAIQSKIPQDAALVEFVQYQPFNAKASKDSLKWGKPRYAAAVLLKLGEPKWVDLGDAATIDRSVITLQQALANTDLRVASATRTTFKKLARNLEQQVMAPIRPLLGNARHILISPDGQLTLIPFEALTDEQGQFLIQRYAFSYLTSGRDLLRFQSPARSRSNPVVLADVDYDNQGQTVARVPTSTGVRGAKNLRSTDFASLVFNHLDATKQEAEAIKLILPDANVLLGKEATVTAVKQLHGPSILHLATHGFFFADTEQNLSPSLGSELEQKPKVLQIENPLLRSGLALASVNKRSQVPLGSDNGVLTAFEVAGLDLRGTQLVVLSACETAKGDVKVGEGVYGLRRALVIAGSQSQVLSLWRVSDRGTKELMVRYYQKLKSGLGRHQALREAQLELLNSQDNQLSLPNVWAAFVPSGDWTPLSK